jgi:hypothetical protein
MACSAGDEFVLFSATDVVYSWALPDPLPDLLCSNIADLGREIAE